MTPLRDLGAGLRGCGARAHHTPIHFSEPGGVLSQALFLFFSTTAISALMRVLPLGPILQRYVLAPFVVSQEELNRLWEPPQMFVRST